MQAIEDKVNSMDNKKISVLTQERLALALPSFKVDSDAATLSFMRMSQNSNLSAIITELISGEVEEVNKLVCDGKIMA